MKTLFQNQKTVVACVQNSMDRKKHMHSAAYMAARHGKTTEIRSDQDIIAAVFDKAFILERGQTPIDHIILPQFLVLQLGDVSNKEFIGSHIGMIIDKRETLRKHTFITLPYQGSVMKKYEDKDLEDLLTVEIKDRGGFINAWTLNMQY